MKHPWLRREHRAKAVLSSAALALTGFAVLMHYRPEVAALLGPWTAAGNLGFTLAWIWLGGGDSNHG